MKASMPTVATKPSAPLWLVYRVLVRQVATRARVAALVVLSSFMMLLGFIGGNHDPTPDDAVGLISTLGLAVILPVGSLIFASGAMADLREDQTLVYLWLRPMRSWVVPLAALLAALTPVLPVTVLAGAVTAELTGIENSLTQATVLATAMGAVAYCGVFVAFGLLVRRTLLWGLMYVLIWEGFIAGAGRGAAQFAIRSYTRSILSRMTKVDLNLADFSRTAALMVLIATAAVSIVLATIRYSRMDVD